MNEPEVSRRLKAARWLRGGVDSNGKPGALSRAELARHPVVVVAIIGCLMMADS
jgi:hypothetical protein